MNTAKIPTAKTPKRLTRQEIANGLEGVGIDSVILGAQSPASRLTHKQRTFAKAIALGNTKAGAYRAAYDTHGDHRTQSRRGQEVANIGAVQAQIAAFRVAQAAAAYSTPALLRSLVIERLTAAAIDPAVKPAQQLRALELLGKVTEVAAFTERREIIKVDTSGTAKSRLLASLRLAIEGSVSDATIKPATELLEELAQAHAEKAGDATPPAPDPHADTEWPPVPMHSTPLKQTRQIVKKKPIFAPSLPTSPTK